MATGNRHDTSRRPATWAERRRRAILRLRFGLAPCTGILAATATLLAGAIPLIGAQAAHLIASICIVELKLFDLGIQWDWLRSTIDAHPALTAAFGGAYHGGFAGIFATRLHDRFFAAFNDDVLQPIGPPLAYDPLWGTTDTEKERDAAAIPWADPQEPGARKDAWDALRTFAFQNAGDGRTTLRGRPTDPDFVAVRWTVLTGRAGAGKTRMAVEFIRRPAGSGLPGGDKKAQERARRRLDCNEW